MNTSSPLSRSLVALEFPEILQYLAGFAVSRAGQEACLALRPQSSLETIRREASFFDQGRIWVERSSFSLPSFPFLDGLLTPEHASVDFSDLDMLWALREVLTLASRLRESILDEVGESLWPLWQQKCQELAFPATVLSALNRCLSDDGMIRDSASPELALVRQELRGLHRQCTTKVKDYATEYNIMHFLQDDFMTLSSDRYVLPLKANFKGRLQGVVHDYSQTGETCYFEPMFLVEVNNRLQSLKREEREEERKVLLYLASLVRAELPSVRFAYSFLVDIDLLGARTALAACYNGRMIETGPEERVFLREACHPLLALAASPDAVKALERFRKQVASRQVQEAQAALSASVRKAEAAEQAKDTATSAAKRPGIKVVSSTLELQKDQHALVISGGNAGGKTVSLKTLGLIALMSRCALPCPVQSGSTLPLWTNIHAFIGDAQSLEDHLSTFTAQIDHLASIWQGLGPQDLVILDEFGAGTDPSQGAALAQAVIDCIVEARSFVIAATHFPALKAYALSTKGVRSASVLFDPATKKPLFRLVYEQAGASQALDVAREHGLPEVILAKANQYLLVSGEDSSGLVERLNQLAVLREKELEELAVEKRKLDERRIKLEERFERDRSRLFDSVQADARKIMADWEKNRIAHKQALRELGEARRKIAPTVEKEEQSSQPALDPASLFVGMKVRHASWGKTGTIQEIDERKKRVRINLDGVSLWAAFADISAVQQTQEKNRAAKGHTGVSLSNFALRLDLRGKRADLARSELEKFLDTAIVQGSYEVEVVHGKGTGALRRELHSYLKDSPVVAAYRLANEEMGGDGMTIVELK